MPVPERYARPGLYLDEDRHEELLDENRDAYCRDRIKELRRELRRLEEQDR